MIKCNAKAAAACESRRLEAITRPQGVWAQVASLRATATRCAAVRLHLRDQRFFSSKAGSNCISFLTRTKANRRLSPLHGESFEKPPKHKTPNRKTSRVLDWTDSI